MRLLPACFCVLRDGRAPPCLFLVPGTGSVDLTSLEPRGHQSVLALLRCQPGFTLLLLTVYASRGLAREASAVDVACACTGRLDPIG